MLLNWCKYTIYVSVPNNIFLMCNDCAIYTVLKSSDSPFDVFDEDVLLVCKYLQAFNLREDEKFGINKSFRGHLGKYVRVPYKNISL